MADTGLQNIKLQDGYVKLLHTKGNDGVNDYLTQVGTSNGPNIVGTPLFLGQKGEASVNENPVVKIKAQSAGNKFFDITDRLGSANDNSGEWPVLEFYSDGSLENNDLFGGGTVNKARGVWSGKCLYDFTGRGSIEFMVLNNSHTATMAGAHVQTFPCIRAGDPDTANNGNVMFSMATDQTTYFQFDRLKVAADGAATPDIIAAGVPARFGEVTADKFLKGVGRTDVTCDIDINASNMLSFKTTGDINLWSDSNSTVQVFGSAKSRFYSDAFGSSGGTAETVIDSFNLIGDEGSSSNVLIGTMETLDEDFAGGSTLNLQGSDAVKIGHNGATYPNITELNSERTIIGNGYLEFNTVADGAGPSDDMSITSAALWSEDSALVVACHSEYGKQLFYRERGSGVVDAFKYTIEKTEVGKSKMLELRDVVTTSTTRTAVTTLPDSTSRIYMKGSKLIVAYHDGDGDATERFYYFDLNGAASTQLIYSGTTEP